jgi:uncharacterized lipoprotein YajG
VLCISENTRTTRTPDFTKKAACILAIAFLAGCAAPPPVKIASKLLGRTVLKEATNDTQDSDAAPETPSE